MKVFKFCSCTLVLLVLLTGGRAWSDPALPHVYQWKNPLTGASVLLDKNWQVLLDFTTHQEAANLDLAFYNTEQEAMLSLYSYALSVQNNKAIDQSKLFNDVIAADVNSLEQAKKEINESDSSINLQSTHAIIKINGRNIGLTHIIGSYSSEQKVKNVYNFYFPDNHARSWLLIYYSAKDSSFEAALKHVTPFIETIFDSAPQPSSDLPTFIPGTYEETEHYPPAQQVVQSIRQKGVQAPYQWQNPFTGHIIPVETGWKLASNTDNTECADHDLTGFAESFCFFDATSNIALSLKRRAPQPLNPYGMVMIDYRNQGEERVAQNDALAYAVSMQSFGPYQLPLLQYSNKSTSKPQSYKVSFDTLKTMWEIEATTTLAIDDPKLSHMITLLFASTQEESELDPQEWNTLQPLPVVEN